MVEIKKIVRSQPLSNYTQAVPSSGGSFGILAAAMETGYNMLLPAAEKEMKDHGLKRGNEWGRNAVGMPANMQMSSMGSGTYNDSLANTESGGNYWAVNSEGYSGKYQWGEARLADYNRATGQNITMAQFLDGTDEAKNIQEKAQAWHNNDIDGKLGDLVGQTVKGVLMTPNALRAAAHLGGVAGARKFVETGGVYDPADSNGTTLSQYARTHGSVGEAAQPYQPPTTILTADGKLESRLFSPLSDPLMQISNAAAGVAYTSEVMLKGMTDVMDMSNNFALDPDGFRQAADGYIENMVKNAPDLFKGDIRAALTDTVQKRFLGIMEDRQADTRQRAANSNMALIDRWRDNLSQAVAAGDPVEIERTRAQLDSVLRVRETLPGLSWTAAQSANEIIKAMDSGQQTIRAASDARSKETKSQLGLIAKAKGTATQFDAVLQDPAVQAQFPEEWREAAGTKAFYDALPSFRQATPDQQRTAADQMLADPIAQDFELDLAAVADKEATASAKAWDAEPIEQAQAVLTQKPPALPSPDKILANPSIAGASLAERVKYGVSLQEAGYTDKARFFTTAERDTLGALFAKDTPPEIKALIAEQVVAAAGPQAKQVFMELSDSDPVTFLAGSLLARGGDRNVAMDAFRGQAMLAQGMVQPPKIAGKIEALAPDISSALDMLPNGVQIKSDTMQLATAIFAASTPPNGESDEQQKARLIEAHQKALGQSKDSKGRVTGGVQAIGGMPTILPPGVSGDQIAATIKSALTATGAAHPRMVARQNASGTPVDSAARAMAAASEKAARGRTDYKQGELPMLEGRPLSPQHADKVFLRPISGNQYAMALRFASGEVTDLRRADGSVYSIDLKKLTGAQ